MNETKLRSNKNAFLDIFHTFCVPTKLHAHFHSMSSSVLHLTFYLHFNLSGFFFINISLIVSNLGVGKKVNEQSIERRIKASVLFTYQLFGLSAGNDESK